MSGASPPFGRMGARVLAIAVLAAACSAQLTPTPPPAGTSPPATSSPSALPPSPTPSEVPSPSETPAPTPTGTPIAWTPGGAVTLPILYMHRVVPIPADLPTWPYAQRAEFLRYMITPCELAASLDWLTANGYTTILPRQLEAYWDRHRPLPSRPVILTFDDGYSDWARTILPALEAHHLVAEFYFTVHRIGVDISWADVRALAAAGMGIGAHDMDHIQLAGYGVTTASPDVMRYQVTTARQVLQQQLGISVDSMAYVGGGFDSTLIGIVRQAGYQSARAIVRGVGQSPATRYALRVSRIGVYDDVIGRNLANAMACDLDPTMADLEARLTGTNLG